MPGPSMGAKIYKQPFVHVRPLPALSLLAFVGCQCARARAHTTADNCRAGGAANVHSQVVLQTLRVAPHIGAGPAAAVDAGRPRRSAGSHKSRSSWPSRVIV